MQLWRWRLGRSRSRVIDRAVIPVQPVLCSWNAPVGLVLSSIPLPAKRTLESPAVANERDIGRDGRTGLHHYIGSVQDAVGVQVQRK